MRRTLIIALAVSLLANVLLGCMLYVLLEEVCRYAPAEIDATDPDWAKEVL